MGAICTVPAIDAPPAIDREFWAVVLADPDLLDEAFAEVLASWRSGPPSAPPGTLTAAAAWPNPVPSRTRASYWQPCRRAHLGVAPRPQVARSPPGL